MKKLNRKFNTVAGYDAKLNALSTELDEIESALETLADKSDGAFAPHIRGKLAKGTRVKMARSIFESNHSRILREGRSLKRERDELEKHERKARDRKRMATPASAADLASLAKALNG